MLRIVTYDVETTGLNTNFNVPLQFAAILQSTAGNQEISVNWRGRPPRHILPSPGALAVTGQRISDVMNAEWSHYQLMREIYRFFELNSPAIVSAFNGIKYDEEILRHSFFATLNNPYITQFDGNSRLDVLKVLRVVPTVMPDAIKFPDNEKGKRSFKLEHVALENGFSGHDAHDALGDVQATIFLVKEIRERAPQVWEACEAWQNKDQMLALLSENEPIVELGWNHMSNRPVAKTLYPVAFDNTNPNECFCVALDSDVEKLVSLPPDKLKSKFRSYKGVTPICSIKANAMPTIVPYQSELAALANIEFSPTKLEIVRSSDGFGERIRIAADLKKSEYEEPTNVRQKLYSGGFFPANADRQLFDLFHNSPVSERFEVAEQMRDPRARELAFWLIGSEWPDSLPEEQLSAYERKRYEHLMLESADWTTVPSAFKEIEALAPDATAEQKNILDEYEHYLRHLWSN